MELDRFCDAMISIRSEIRRIESGEMPGDDNLLKNAPHTAFDLANDQWKRTSEGKLAFPTSRSGKNIGRQ
jgi:glycine dehydrogenase